MRTQHGQNCIAGRYVRKRYLLTLLFSVEDSTSVVYMLTAIDIHKANECVILAQVLAHFVVFRTNVNGEGSAPKFNLVYKSIFNNSFLPHEKNSAYLS